MLLAKRFTINPVLVIISLVFWFWMWGVPGVVLAVPMLAITKIICDRVRPLAAFYRAWALSLGHSPPYPFEVTPAPRSCPRHDLDKHTSGQRLPKKRETASIALLA
jgi:hypothetical protein